MASVNKVILIGNLGKDPEMRYTPGNVAVCNFSLATNDKWKDKAGQMQERTEWHKIVVWGRQAEIAKEYLAKGRQVYIEGSLQTREWNDKEGNKKYTTEVRADRLQFIGTRDGASGGGAPRSTGDAGPAGGGGGEFTDPGYSDDDIPF